MHETIYYFSGTGNSLAAARGLAEQIGNTKIVNIVAPITTGGMADHTDTVGLVFPVYFEDMPDIVRRFVEKLQLEPNTYVFGLATCGSGPGLALHTLDRLLKKKGAKLAAGFSLEMPDNSIIIFNMIPPLDVQKSMLERSLHNIKQIAEIVKRKEVFAIEGKKRLRDRLERLFMKAIVTRIYKTPKRFRTTDKCTKCGSCRRVCPTGNIEVKNGEIKWGNNCTHCLACLHWCPATAINLGRGSNQKRYHHPDITVQDMRLR